MLKKLLCAIAVMVAAQGPLVQAQQQLKVISPDGSVRYEAAPPAAAPSGATTVSGVSYLPLRRGNWHLHTSMREGQERPQVGERVSSGQNGVQRHPGGR